MKPLLIIATILLLAAVIVANVGYKAQEKDIPYMDTTNVVYKIARDTVYIDRSRPINKPWYSYEIESGEDSIYLYSGRELIGVVGRKEATVFYIDSLIINDNL